MPDFVNAAVLLANFVIVPALAYGAQLALGALGVTLVFGVLRFSNFAHGDTMAFGTTVTILATWWLQSHGIGAGVLPTALLALPVGILATIVLLLANDRFIYRYYRKARAKPITLLMVSLGVMFLFNGLVRFIIGPDDRRFGDGAAYLVEARDFKASFGLSEGLTIRTSQAITLVVAVLLIAALFFFLQKSGAGTAMRAYSDNEDLALLSGVNPDAVVRLAWILTAVLATVAGVLYGLDKSFKPFTYFQLLLPIFAAAIVGGLGKPVGAIVGGFVVSFSEIGLTYAYRKVVIYLAPNAEPGSDLMQLVSTDYKYAVSFVILVIVLLIAPQGILKGKTQ